MIISVLRLFGVCGWGSGVGVDGNEVGDWACSEKYTLKGRG